MEVNSIHFIIGIIFLLYNGICGRHLDVCPPQLTRDDQLQRLGDHCYQFLLSERHQYHNADALCQEHGGDVLTVGSETVQQFITDKLNITYKFKGQVWINQKDKAGKENCTVFDTSSKTWTTTPCKNITQTDVKAAVVCEFRTGMQSPKKQHVISKRDAGATTTEDDWLVKYLGSNTTPSYYGDRQSTDDSNAKKSTGYDDTSRSQSTRSGMTSPGYDGRGTQGWYPSRTDGVDRREGQGYHSTDRLDKRMSYRTTTPDPRVTPGRYLRTRPWEKPGEDHSTHRWDKRRTYRTTTPEPWVTPGWHLTTDRWHGRRGYHTTDRSDHRGLYRSSTPEFDKWGGRKKYRNSAPRYQWGLPGWYRTTDPNYDEWGNRKSSGSPWDSNWRDRSTDRWGSRRSHAGTTPGSPWNSYWRDSSTDRWGSRRSYAGTTPGSPWDSYWRDRSTDRWGSRRSHAATTPGSPWDSYWRDSSTDRRGSRRSYAGTTPGSNWNSYWRDSSTDRWGSRRSHAGTTTGSPWDSYWRDRSTDRWGSRRSYAGTTPGYRWGPPWRNTPRRDSTPGSDWNSYWRDSSTDRWDSRRSHAATTPGSPWNSYWRDMSTDRWDSRRSHAGTTPGYRWNSYWPVTPKRERTTDTWNNRKQYHHTSDEYWIYAKKSNGWGWYQEKRTTTPINDVWTSRPKATTETERNVWGWVPFRRSTPRSDKREYVKPDFGWNPFNGNGGLPTVLPDWDWNPFKERTAPPQKSGVSTTPSYGVRESVRRTTTPSPRMTSPRGKYHYSKRRVIIERMKLVTQQLQEITKKLEDF